MGFVEDAINRHNVHRSKHGAENLTESKELTAIAQKWANHLASTGTFEHSKSEDSACSKGPTGENLYMYWTSTKEDNESGEAATDAWYNEIELYDFEHGGFSMKTGHFTQVVWKGTKEIGIAKAQAQDGTVYTVANYYPPGNYQGQFAENVLPPSGLSKSSDNGSDKSSQDKSDKTGQNTVNTEKSPDKDTKKKSKFCVIL